MKKLVVVLGCGLGLAMAYVAAVKTHLIKPVDWLTFAHLRKNDHLFHGSAVNTAREDKNDPYWQKAYGEIKKNPGLLASSQTQGAFAGRIERGNPGVPEIALTFDDGPHIQTAHALVQELKSLNLHATFFVVGKMVEKHPELIREEAAAGNEIGNHSFSHTNLSKLPEQDVYVEFRACNLLLKHVLGYPARFCRPPGGDSDPLVFEAAKANGLDTVLWTDDPLDYSNPGEDEIMDRTLRRLSNGGILLLHEGVKETMSVLPLITKEIRDRGFKIVTVGQLMRDSAIAQRGAVAQLTTRPTDQ